MVDAPQGWHRGRPRSGLPVRGWARRARPQTSDSDQRHRGGTPDRPGVEPASAGAAATFSFGRVSSRNRSTAPGSSGEGNRSRNRPLAAVHPKIPRETQIRSHATWQARRPGCLPSRRIPGDRCRIFLYELRLAGKPKRINRIRGKERTRSQEAARWICDPLSPKHLLKVKPFTVALTIKALASDCFSLLHCV